MRIFYRLFLLSLLWIIVCTGAKAKENLHQQQQFSRRNPYHHVYKTILEARNRIQFALPAEATSISLQIHTTQTFKDAYIISENDTFLLAEDTHTRENSLNGKIASNLIIFPNAVKQITFYSGELSGEVVFHILNAGKAATDHTGYRRAGPEDDCSKPATVSQQVWRAGLPSPAQLPEATQPAHIIVHHSATLNTLTDYTNVVRNIYLYHTQANGWNDIGYNFLIAADGTIFEGRDGRNTIEDDNVQGAHFCGKNKGTMGVCLLGTYTSTTPTQKALTSLVNLASWKAHKENLDAISKTLHPPGTAGAALLNVIAGHRDGCSTECPGDVTYTLLPTLRTQIKNQTDACKGALAKEITLYPQPASKEVFVRVTQEQNIRSFVLYDITGKILQTPASRITANEIRLDTYPLAAGMYILQVQLGDSKSFTRKMLVL